MPKGKNVAPVQRMEWLQAHDRGDTIAEIAERASRSERTVTGQIARSRREREQTEVRAGLLKDAYRQHYDDLIALAERINGDATSMGAGALSHNLEGRAGMLLEGLREHVPRSPLWKACRDREYCAREFSRQTEQLRDEIDEAVEEDPAVLRDTLIESLRFAAHETAQGNSLDHMKYEHSTAPKGTGLRWGAFPLSDALSDGAEADGLQESHEALVNLITGLDTVGRLARTLGEWKKTRQTIRQEVDLIGLRRLLPGQCRLCPQ